MDVLGTIVKGNISRQKDFAVVCAKHHKKTQQDLEAEERAVLAGSDGVGQATQFGYEQLRLR